jgi:hypothetical protein
MALPDDPAELVRGPLLKIERAKQHVTDLDGKISEYVAGTPFELRVREREQLRDRLIYIQAEPPIPDEFALILGDAVHNLRTALDHLIFAIVRDEAPQPRQVGFPFVEKEESLTSAIATRQVHIAPKEVIAALHALKPYPAGNKYLHAVKSIDERDKHHFILTVGLGIELTFSQLGNLVGAARLPGLVPTNARVATVGDFCVQLSAEEAKPDSDRKADFQPPFTIGFGQGETLVGEPVIPALKQMASATEDAVLRLGAAAYRS